MPLERTDAVEEALTLFRSPSAVRDLRKRVLPSGMLGVIRIAAGDSESTRHFSDVLQVDDALLKEAASFYMQQIITTAGVNNLRMLGLAAGASAQDIKEHKRWLLKWLHPDRNPSAWQQVLFYKVGQAADALKAEAGKVEDVNSAAQVVASSKRGTRQALRREHFRARRMVRVVQWQIIARRVVVSLAILLAVAALLVAADSANFWGLK